MNDRNGCSFSFEEVASSTGGDALAIAGLPDSGVTTSAGVRSLPDDAAPATAGTGEAPGTFGELLQGALDDEWEHFMVTLPICCYARATFMPIAGCSDIEIIPRHKTKTLTLAQKYSQLLGVRQGGRLVIESDLPEGKGLASSTADLVAAARALASFYRQPLPQETLLALLRELEPSDGVMYSTHAFFYHRRVQLGTLLGDLPPLTIIALDEGGVIDTIEYNRTAPAFSPAEKQEYRVCLDKMLRAFREQDVRGVGEVSSRSAELQQQRRPKRFYREVLEICRQARGLGVVVTHSGPCIGILLAEDDPDFTAKVAQIRTRFSALSPTILSYQTLTKQRPIGNC